MLGEFLGENTGKANREKSVGNRPMTVEVSFEETSQMLESA